MSSSAIAHFNIKVNGGKMEIKQYGTLFFIGNEEVWSEYQKRFDHSWEWERKTQSGKPIQYPCLVYTYTAEGWHDTDYWQHEFLYIEDIQALMKDMVKQRTILKNTEKKKQVEIEAKERKELERLQVKYGAENNA
jgi:hypothetical protein